MRITGGERRGQIIKPNMKNWPTRPTTDLAKEALYNILANRIDFEQVRMLDLFGGTGSHVWEVLSRGCQHAVYVDHFAPCVNFVKAQAMAFGYDKKLQVIKSDVKKYISTSSDRFDLIFADPPYGLSWLGQLADYILSGTLLNTDGLLVIEHDQNQNFQNHHKCFDVRKYGATRFSFFR
jgi:16S rRNA (guanine(966)-N(2))-methyltransferase RsmD